jgi:V/A-type H+-transporting ATPase subunit D
MAQTAPTIGILWAAKRSRVLAESGYELMDKKRNILIRELMSMIDAAGKLQDRIDSTFGQAYAAMRLADISMGGSADGGAKSVPSGRLRSLRCKSVMGVEIQSINRGKSDLGTAPPPYGLAFTLPTLTSPISSLRGKGACERAGADGKTPSTVLPTPLRRRR